MLASGMSRCSGEVADASGAAATADIFGASLILPGPLLWPRRVGCRLLRLDRQFGLVVTALLVEGNEERLASRHRPGEDVSSIEIAAADLALFAAFDERDRAGQ